MILSLPKTSLEPRMKVLRQSIVFLNALIKVNLEVALV